MDTTVSFYIDAKEAAMLKDICADKGVTMQDAFSQFVRKSLKGVKRISLRERIADKVSEYQALRAFNSLRRAAKRNGTAGMSMEEIDAEIALCRAGMGK